MMLDTTLTTKRLAHQSQQASKTTSGKLETLVKPALPSLSALEAAFRQLQAGDAEEQILFERVWQQAKVQQLSQTP